MYKLDKTGRAIIGAVIAGSLLTISFLSLSSCNVTRTTTTKSEYYQRGDTSCTIVTKTIESYDGKKNL